MARKYELRRRAEGQAETRRRIVEAAVHLHGTVGPARTTVSAIAEQAGVERRTFYRHFPEPAAIFEACSAHFRAEHPPPDPTAWHAIADPDKRLRVALEQCYHYYRRNTKIIENVLRDRTLGIPVGEGLLRHRAAAVRTLLDGFGSVSPAYRRSLAAAIELALDFHTWHILAQKGLTDRQAANLTVALATAAEHGPRAFRQAP